MSNQQKAAPPLDPSPQPDGRSEGLLPTDGPDPNLEVAEEVSLDLQSDSTRRVGALPPDTPVSKPAEALAQSLQPDAKAQEGNLQCTTQESDRLHEAIDRSVPPSV